MMDGIPGPATEEVLTVEKYIGSCPTQIREIIEILRSVAKTSMQGAHEFLYHDAINYKLTESPGEWISYIAPQKNYVRFGFFYGNHLSDPMKLLEGTVRRMRHVKVRSVEEVSTNVLANLIRQAWADSPKSQEAAY